MTAKLLSRATTGSVASLALFLGLLIGGGATPCHAQEFPAVWPDATELESFLKEAKVIERRKLGTGITNPDKLTLEMDGVVRHAVFKNVDGDFDSWRAEVAAYEMDKLLGLGMVPPTVERKVRGAMGCAQLWVEGRTMEKFTGTPPDLDAWRRQVSLMWLFDDLVGNIDRHVNNVIVTEDFRLALIDNSKTFRGGRELLNDLNRSGSSGTRAAYWQVPFDKDTEEYPTRYPAAVIDKIRSLTGKEVKATIGRYIRSYDRGLIFDRRKLVLERLEELGGVVDP